LPDYETKHALKNRGTWKCHAL